jgi:hypothetical protein
LKKFYAKVETEISLPDNIHIEKFPITHSPVQAIKLPFVVHSISQKRSFFIDDSGERLPDLSLPAFTSVEYKSLNFDTATESVVTVSRSKDSSSPHLLAVENGCGFIKAITSKARTEHYLNYHEKNALMYTFMSLGDAGRKFIHSLLGHCMDYDYNITERFLNKCDGLYPIGCKKLHDRFEDKIKCDCTCSINIPKMYPSPVCHAMKVMPGCFKLPKRDESMGHFKTKAAKPRLNALVAQYAELTRKSAELRSMEAICSEQLDLLFEKQEMTEADTELGKLVKIDNGYYLKLG